MTFLAVRSNWRRISFPPQFLQVNPQYKSHFGGAPNRSDRSQRRTAAVADIPALDPAQIAAHTLVAAGQLDVLVPPALTLELGARIPGAGSTVLDGMGHIGHVQAPHRVAAYIREFFLVQSLSNK